MKKEISPVIAAIIIVVVVAVLGFVGYKIFLQPKAPDWTPPANYGASRYGQPPPGR
ncbi:MAG: hypothetical protein RMM08_02640 [Armatimonadota bacterium]|nr:hypothetical protein [bacterium]MDW8320236.1 hypothetical protein [Armatimonadota bacterium]